MELKNKTNKLLYEKEQILSDIKAILLDMPNRTADISKYGINNLHSISLSVIGEVIVTTNNFNHYDLECLTDRIEDYRDILEVLEDVQKTCCKTYGKDLWE